MPSPDARPSPAGTCCASAAPPSPLTWMGHSCIRIERDGFVTIIDPGILSAPDAAAGTDALLISHRHLDHYDTGKIAAVVCLAGCVGQRAVRDRESAIFRAGVPGRSDDPTLPSRQ